MTVLTTQRLRLEPYADAHLEQLNEMNRDPDVMRYITGRAETLEETRASIERVKARWAEWGYSWWSFFEHHTGRIIGSGCIQHLGHDAANRHELGYRLRRDKWGQGFASEAARVMAGFAFETLRAPELTAVCQPENKASAQVMMRLGMTYRGVEQWYGADLSLYAMTAADWQRALNRSE